MVFFLSKNDIICRSLESHMTSFFPQKNGAWVQATMNYACLVFMKMISIRIEITFVFISIWCTFTLAKIFTIPRWLFEGRCKYIACSHSICIIPCPIPKAQDISKQLFLLFNFSKKPIFFFTISTLQRTRRVGIRDW